MVHAGHDPGEYRRADDLQHVVTLPDRSWRQRGTGRVWSLLLLHSFRLFCKSLAVGYPTLWDACEPLPLAARSLFLATWFFSFHQHGNG